MALICLAPFAFAVPSANAQCGEITNVSPRRSLGPGPAPLAVGDSVLYDAAQALSYYGFEANAMVCRTMAQGIVWLGDHAQSLPPLVVVALGTNGAVTTGQIDQLLTIVGPGRLLAMVTPHHGNYAYVPGLIRSAAQRHPARIVVLDWARLSATHSDWFAPDGIHLGSTAGIDAFARLVAGALLATPTPAPAPTVPSPVPAPQVIHHPKPKPKPPRSVKPVRSPAAAGADRFIWPTVAAIEALSLSLVGV